MGFYLMADTIQPCTEKELFDQTSNKYIACLTTPEWIQYRDRFDMGIELEPDSGDIHNTKAEVNYDSLTGTFRIPDRENIGSKDFRFAFALDEKGIVFIDDSGKAEQMIKVIRRTKRWREPSLERVNEIHSDIRKLLVHYEQLIDMTQELEENENGFFSEENLRYIHLFMNLLARRHDSAASLRDYTMQVRDLYHAQLEVRQNRIMTLLTVVTTIFMPLTLIVGWYGMNFRYMPELEWRFGYPVVIVVSIAVAVACLLFFKKKKWL